MDEEEHRQLRGRAERNEVLIGIDRAAARNFFTNVSTSRMRELTGEALLVEKAAVMTVFVCGPLFLLGAVALMLFAFGWWGLAAAPVGILTYFVHHGTSVRGSARLLPITIVVVVLVAVWLAGLLPSHRITAAALLFGLSLWCSRFLYVGSTLFLRAAVLRSAQAFNALKEAVTLREPGAP